MALAGSASPQHRTACEAWLALLRGHQLTEGLGWQPADSAYGGWSYAHEPPTPVHGQPASALAEPNLSATVFAIEALRSPGLAGTDRAFQSAKQFVERCQNWAADRQCRDARFDDGGFCFVRSDSVRNKAGEAGTDQDGRIRYTSYGSATADGLRALLALGVAPDHPRVAAARNWLVDHFSADSHPGDYPPDREHLRQALYYYYSASVAQAFVAVTAQGHGSSALPPSWPLRLAVSLLSRQKPDGSWSNPAVILARMIRS
jgi:squalene-hopene/tetraprenyl-beta-curcumene cyclase